jgi:uncharacterized BrkB/YihY/UPF0761 family membrane protein
MRRVELGLCVLLALGGLAHLGGTFAGYEAGTEMFVWSVSATAFVFTIVFLHVLRILRPSDLPVAYAAVVTTIVWIVIALGFGSAVGDVADPRALTHVIISAALLLFAVRHLSYRKAALAGSAS